MKKSNLLLVLSMTALIAFTGCSKQVQLESGLAKNADIKSCAYDVTVTVDATGLKNTDSATNSEISSVLTAGKVSLNFNGKTLKTDARTKLSSNIKVSAGGISFETPAYVDTSNSKLDFDLFIGLPDMFKSMLGSDLTNISNLYLSSKDLDTFMKTNNSEEDYKKFEDTMTKALNTKNSKSSQVSKDMALSFNSYLTKNKAKVETFTKLGKASASKNGVYTVKLSKADIKAIVSDYFSNKTYFTNFKNAIKDVQGMSSSTSNDKIKELEDLDAKSMISDFNKELDNTKALTIVSTFTIEDNFVTKTNFKSTITSEEGPLSFEINSKLSDINKVTSITAPDKKSDKTLDIMTLINKNILGSDSSTSGN